MARAQHEEEECREDNSRNQDPEIFIIHSFSQEVTCHVLFSSVGTQQYGFQQKKHTHTHTLCGTEFTSTVTAQ